MIQEFTEEKAAAIAKGSPWSHLTRKPTKAEYEALTAWRKANPDKRYRMGFRRGDGRVFRQYSPCCNGGELWSDMATIDRLRDIARARAKIIGTPEFKREKNRKRREEYAAHSDIRIKQRAALDAWRARVGEAEFSRRRKITMRKANKNPRHIESKKRWAEQHCDEVRASVNEAASQRRARVRYSAISSAADRDKIREIFDASTERQVRTGELQAVDHIIPLFKGGFHHEKNMQILPFSTNNSKSDDSFWISTDYLDFRDVPEFLWPEKLAPIYRQMKRLLGHPLKRLADNF